MEGLDWLLRWAKPGYILAALLAAAAVNVGTHHSDVWRRWYRERFFPPQRLAVDPELAAQSKRAEQLKVQGFYRKVSALLEEARGNGFSVDGLQAKANAALDLERAGFRDAAMTTLAEVEMQVPRKPVQYIPMDPAQPDEQYESPDLLPSQVPAQKAPPKAAKKAKRKQRRKRTEDAE